MTHDSANPRPRLITTFFWGFLTALLISIAFIMIDNKFFEGMLTTQFLEIGSLEEETDDLELELEAQEMVSHQLASYLGIEHLESVEMLALLGLDEAHIKALLKEEDIDEKTIHDKVEEIKALRLSDDQRIQALLRKNNLSEEQIQDQLKKITHLETEVAFLKSQFEGAFRDVLKDYPDVSMSGERFAFKDDIFFQNGSSMLSPSGKLLLDRLGSMITKIAGTAPKTIPWFIRIDGHTNHLKIKTERYPSNWYLSCARAISVINYLIYKGVPPHRLVAAGFSSYWPLVLDKSPEALEKNRRIEIAFSHY